MKLISGNCPICQAAIKSADNQAQFNRNKGLHLLVAHNQPGQKRYIPVAERPGHPKYKPLIKSDVAMNVYRAEMEDKAKLEAANALRRKRYQEQYRLRKKQETQQKQQALSIQNGQNVVPAYLCECPNQNCKTRFYMVIPNP